jgi:hypothetical protein
MGYGSNREERQAPRRRRSKRGSNRGLLIIGGAVVVVIVVVAVVAVVTMGGGSGKKPQAAAAARVVPKIYVNTPENSLVKKLNDRSKDKRPLNKSEIFNDQTTTVTHGTYTFKLVGSALTPCAEASWGQQLQNDLKKYGCSQIARGAYVTKDKKYVGQFVALNLSQLAGAEQIVRDLDPGSSAGFVTPLAPPGVEDFGGGFSAAYSQSFGHYVVISWVERAGGGQPQTMNELLDASIAIERADDFVWERLVLVGG